MPPQQRFRKKDSWVMWPLLTLYMRTLYMFYCCLFECVLAEITFLKQGTMRSFWMWLWIHNMYTQMQILTSGEFIFQPKCLNKCFIMFQLDVSLCSMCNFVLWQNWAYRTKKRLVGDRKRLWSCFTGFCCHRYPVLMKLSQRLIKNIKFCCD